MCIFFQRAPCFLCQISHLLNLRTLKDLMNNNYSQDCIASLNYYALQLRIDSIRATAASKSGHPTSCLSIADIIAALFFYQMKYDTTNPHVENNDRVILSKGHAIPVVYAAWKQLGVISDEQLMELRSSNSPLEGHPTFCMGSCKLCRFQ